MTKIAIVGKPNVGKSSLFNRLAKERDAITSDMAGTTRDIKTRVVPIGEGEKEAEIIDTGGIDESNLLFAEVKRRSIKAAKESDIILYMVDGKTLPDEEDKKLYYELQGAGRPIALVVNKIDNDKMKENAWGFAEFGAENQFEISVSHNRGVLKLIRWLERLIPEESDIAEDQEEDFDSFLAQYDEEGEFVEPDDEVDASLKVAIIGRVNVGKSSLLNALLGEDRSVVSDVAGTTIDPVDETMVHGERLITFVDTAGIRRRGKIDGIEKYALDRTQKALEKAHIVLVVLDCSEPFVDLDEKISGLVDTYGLGCIIILNKWDIAHEEYKKIEEEVRRRFKFLYYAPLITVSALNKRHIDRIKDKILEVYENFSQRIPTSVLNRAIEEAVRRHRVPSEKGRVVRIYYATQFASQPPQIALIMNRPESLHFSYQRYLVNFMREQGNFEGTPIRFFPRKRGERAGDSEE